MNLVGSKSYKVVRLFMQRVEKRRGEQNAASPSKESSHLGECSPRIGDMLEHLGTNYKVDALGRKRDCINCAEVINRAGSILHNVRTVIGRAEAFDKGAERLLSAPDIQHAL